MKYFLVISLFFLVLTVQAQDDVLDKIASASCDCIENTKLSENEKQRTQQLGICIIQAGTQYEKELKDQYDISLADLSGRNGRKFGEMVGLRMAGKCPQVLVAATDNQVSAADRSQSITGTVTEIAQDQFYTIEIESESRVHKILWLEPFKNSHELLEDKMTVVGRKIRIIYKENELFDPKINEYRSFKVIDGFEWL